MKNVQERDFPTVEELSKGFSEFKLSQANELVGTKVILNYENGYEVIYEFLDNETIRVKCINEKLEEKVSSIYTVVAPRKRIYIIDFIWSFGETKSFTTVIDFNKNIATTLIAQLPNKEEVSISQFERGDKGLPLTSVKAEFVHASIDTKFNSNTLKHEFTSDLIGKRILFKYSSKDTYEHIYLNENYYTWHCVSGIEKGLCDTDRCFYLKIEENLYWFTWLERVVPTVGTVVEDLDLNKMRSYGKIYGYESYEIGKVTNFPIGSYGTMLNKTEY
ncbi:molybdenum cofactor biosynthesis F family protein [Clostridium sp. SHJSY1]|uniref:molybdenum cofactor biosynthesis F family protein n=1 Tax=Clostridium sp. SHJSY1 TaxID=2942483 RepID=UPI0028755FF3|nr:molybdenum cofactor biosynthesis F family protein [Clostridium sp. SHJSY1]MDS0525816.1 molybdenum cofactor biosynthesis F family protein [Clostridium sp. SHJSY1]